MILLTGYRYLDLEKCPRKVLKAWFYVRLGDVPVAIGLN